MKQKYNAYETELSCQKLWDAHKVFSYEKSEKPLYSIDTPPPTVSGSLHIGHVFSYTQTDIIARYKRMSGYNVAYPFGFDDNGLPTERYVEKKRKITAHSVGRAEFVKACREEIKEAHNTFIELWKHVGLSCDWDMSYSTISPEVQKISQKSFVDLYKKGFVYRKQEPALYCTACRTSVAQAELEDIEKETWFNTIIFKTSDNQDILVATTRPELLASCVAVLYHPDDSRYKHLKGAKLTVPYFGFEVPVFADGKVLPDKGTGIVMTCTFGDALDVYWFKKHGFEYRQSIGLDGKMTSITGELEGLTVVQAREKIIELLEKNNLLKEKEKVSHRVSVYERSKKEIEYVMISQWFLKILPYKKDFLELADSITWRPEHMKHRFINWVEGLQWDWCLSRQRTFGIPFPVWYDQQGNVIIAEESQLPVDPTTDKPLHHEGTVTPDTDVMDTWNTSSLTPYICQHVVEKAGGTYTMPMNMRPQAHDIIRTWAFYTIVKSWMHDKKIPWHDIVISGHVVAKDKQKISKSKGNNPLDPHTLLKNYSADAIRYWTASSLLGTDTSFSETQLKDGNRLVVKLWNAGLFVEEHGDLSCMHQPQIVSSLLNQWILVQLNECMKEYKKHFDNYEYNLALKAIESFFWNDFCDNYLEIAKHQFFEQSIHLFSDSERKETSSILSFVYVSVLKAFSPFVIYITEHMYQRLYNKEVFASVHKSHLNEVELSSISSSEPIADSMQIVLDVVSAIRKAKSEHNTSLKTSIKKLCLKVKDNNHSSIINEHARYIKSIGKVELIETGINLIENSVYNQNENLFSILYIDLTTLATLE